ncbi:PQQ-dependent oxidoreductase, gdhB family [Thioalkalivibrio nitratireducens DSM 14787]|uniref:PQQ-dependent oxidoreductase, gdhB family n=1 Tax=Thioalkalivibrio nitratireducens (strain DSM 14787 / UNIQEM 213 / ALEN2) TaxID=1255043 RepID=L0DZU4_THIND|nr:PQQ-dependent sugar dehydrogenase [Thioalkalivibrio nitratireducens]AGA34573.1 PQQ-dependent oxidoreductase, gdhB family [Thioalkalivibrio nitratireducens DSM 14787]
MHKIPPLLGSTLATALLWGTTASAMELIQEIGTEYERLRLVQVVDGLAHPWAVAFLPDGRKLITERARGLYLVENGAKTRVEGVPDFHAQNQGGLLDVVVHPHYEDNGWIYLTYSRGDRNATVPALARARLDGNRLVDVEELFESNEPTRPGRHYGSRVVFLDDDTLLMSIGDRGAEPPRAQDSLDHSGSVVRLNDDGSVPADNPFVGKEGYAPELYTYGNRNIQGIVQHPATGDIWATEHGPRGGDELNLIEPGNNYGWPTATLGRDYRTEGPFPDAETRHRDGMVDPVFEFLPTLAPSGLAVVSGERFPRWEGNLLAGGLRAQRILRLVIENRTVVHAEELLPMTVGRIRDVRQGPDGYIYLLNDAPDAALYRLEPSR